MIPNRILISRTDSIGDVMLTLPMCVWIKKQFPLATLIYLGKSYTKPVVNCFSVVDEFVDWNTFEKLPTVEKINRLRELNIDTIIHVFPNKEIAQLAKKTKIKHRIGTSHRGFHFLTCNNKVNFTRKNAKEHESQLNFHLLKPLGLKEIPSLEEVNKMTEFFSVPTIELPNDLAIPTKKSIVLHPKSQGSAVEWPIESYIRLAEKLTQNNWTVYFTGTEKEGLLFREFLPANQHIIDLTGKLDLTELIVFISKVTALVACSTGPLHIAGFVNTHTIGLFSPRIPIHPGRWQPLGKNVDVFVFDPSCKECGKKNNCACIQKINVDTIFHKITSNN
jgi:heptosyltransferase III